MAPRESVVLRAFEAEKWRRGFRPPASFHEANGRIRAEIREGRLRARGGGG